MAKRQMKRSGKGGFYVKKGYNKSSDEAYIGEFSSKL